MKYNGCMVYDFEVPASYRIGRTCWCLDQTIRRKVITVAIGVVKMTIVVSSKCTGQMGYP